MERIMEKVEITKIIYKTRDGKSFDTEQAAQAHEDHLDVLDYLEQFRVPGPKSMTTGAEGAFKRVYVGDYNWYKMNSEDDLIKISNVYKGLVHVPTSYPDYIAIPITESDIAHSKLLSDIIFSHIVKEKAWNEFIGAFEFTDDEKDKLLQANTHRSNQETCKS